ncbi:MAG: HAD family phosphatase [Deltaproteobacteria bacterium]|nr:HAD family phosphatase [Deltaproteobacteria bacterium]
MNKYCVIFDMDGVLVDSCPFHLVAWKMFAHKYGLHLEDRVFYQTFGLRNDEIIPLFFPNHFSPADYRKLDREKEALYRECIKGKVVPPNGLTLYINDLIDHGFLIAVGSSGPRENVQLILAETNLTHKIKISVSGDDVKHGKPDPEIFIKAARLCGVSPLNTVVIEDASAGIRAAKNAQMKAIGITSTATPDDLGEADLIIGSFPDINAEKTIGLITGHLLI